ncbi:hypothetical protein [Verrucomicrobium spinosum]|uniref:hypothetical protein n=1 Tax=Verrucomicrobium spinosum TaxID=2736 RepID=UPI00017452E9|nr:hypothetical protein [Verrucomicrobium spinosum]
MGYESPAKLKKAQEESKQLLLGFTSSITVKVTPHPGGGVLVTPGKVLVEGSVSDAAKALGLPNKQLVYLLIEEKEIHAWKPNARAKNGKYRVNMASVYALKAKWLAQQDQRV